MFAATVWLGPHSSHTCEHLADTAHLPLTTWVALLAHGGWANTAALGLGRTLNARRARFYPVPRRPFSLVCQVVGHPPGLPASRKLASGSVHVTSHRQVQMVAGDTHSWPGRWTSPASFSLPRGTEGLSPASSWDLSEMTGQPQAFLVSGQT